MCSMEPGILLVAPSLFLQFCAALLHCIHNNVHIGTPNFQIPRPTTDLIQHIFKSHEHIVAEPCGLRTSSAICKSVSDIELLDIHTLRKIIHFNLSTFKDFQTISTVILCLKSLLLTDKCLVTSTKVLISCTFWYPYSKRTANLVHEVAVQTYIMSTTLVYASGD